MWKLMIMLLAAPVFAERSYVQKLLDTDLSGPALYAAYDAHYDALTQGDKMKEKADYPPDVYKDLLEHRKTLKADYPPDVYKDLLEHRKTLSP